MTLRRGFPDPFNLQGLQYLKGNILQNKKILNIISEHRGGFRFNLVQPLCFREEETGPKD